MSFIVNCLTYYCYGIKFKALEIGNVYSLRGKKKYMYCYQKISIGRSKHRWKEGSETDVNPLNAELNPICHLLALLGGATIVVVSRLRVNLLQYCAIPTEFCINDVFVKIQKYFGGPFLIDHPLSILQLHVFVHYHEVLHNY